MALLQTLVFASSLGYAVGVQVCPQGSIDGKPFPCYDAGNITTAAYDSTGAGGLVFPIVATMRTQASLLVPEPKTTTTPAPTPDVNCGCVMPAPLDKGEYYQGMTPEGRPIAQPDAAQKMQPAGSCTTTCITAFPTYYSPRVENTQTTLNGPGGPTPAPPHLVNPQTTLDRSKPNDVYTVPIKNLPQMTIPVTTEETPRVEHQDITLDGWDFGPPAKQSQVVKTTATTSHYLVHSQTIIPGAPPVVYHGTTYSIPRPMTVISETTYPAANPTPGPVVYVNGQSKPIDQVPGLQTDEHTVIAIHSHTDQGIGGGGYAMATYTESVAYTTSGGSTYFSQRVQTTQTRLDVPTGSGTKGGTMLTTSSTASGSGSTLARSSTASGSGSTLATSIAASGSGSRGSQTTSSSLAQQTESAAGRVTISAVCLGAVMFAMAML